MQHSISTFFGEYSCCVSCDICSKKTKSYKSYKECYNHMTTRDGGRFQVLSSRKTRKKYGLNRAIHICFSCKKSLIPAQKNKSIFDWFKKLLRF